jgi:hypothetical protein
MLIREAGKGEGGKGRRGDQGRVEQDQSSLREETILCSSS